MKKFKSLSKKLRVLYPELNRKKEWIYIEDAKEFIKGFEEWIKEFEKQTIFSEEELSTIYAIVGVKFDEFIRLKNKLNEEIVRAYLCSYLCREKKFKLLRDGILGEMKEKGDKFARGKLI